MHQDRKKEADLKRIWKAMVEELMDALRHRHAAAENAAPDGWTWSVTKDLVTIKSREVWVRRGAPEPAPSSISKLVSGLKKLLGGNHASTPGPHRSDWSEAERILEGLSSKGVPLSEEICHRETSEATLEFLRHLTESELSPAKT
jgi:hypothetical protein